MMPAIIDVTGGQGGKAFLLLGQQKTALIDSGMAYCAAGLIANARQALAGRDLDYILISHSHYDHIGAIPYLRAVWPSLQVLGAEYARRVLAKPGVQQTVRDLGAQAARLYGAGDLPPYDPACLQVDRVVGDGDSLDLGGRSVSVLETQGHTQCSLSFLVDDGTLFASESTGCLSSSGRIFPAFINSYDAAVRSIEASQALKPRAIVSPHYGPVGPQDTPGYWQKCLLAARAARNFILLLAERGLGEDQILAKYEQVYRDEQNRREQPLQAFRLNTGGMIRTVLKEHRLQLPLAQ